MANEQRPSDGSYLSANPEPLEPNTLESADLESPIDDFGLASGLKGSPYATVRYRLSAADLRKAHRHLAMRSPIPWWIVAFVEAVVFVLVLIARQTSPDPQTASWAGFGELVLVLGAVAAGFVWVSWRIAIGISILRGFRVGTADRYCAFYDGGVLAVERNAEVAFIPWRAIASMRRVGRLRVFIPRTDRGRVWIVPAEGVVGDLERLARDTAMLTRRERVE